MKSSKGVQRLAVLLGGIGITAWILLFVIATEFFRTFRTETLPVVSFVGVAFFVVPFVLVHTVAWVVRGFREDKRESKDG